MAEASLVTERAFLMGSPFAVQAWAAPAAHKEVKRWIALAFGEIRRLEDLLTDFRDSPFNRINDMAGIAPVKVCREIIDVIQRSLRLSHDTGGAFDISYASIGLLWRAAEKTGIPPAASDLERAKAQVDYRRIQVDEGACEVFLPHREMRIGLGGIGKGYAVDRAFDLLRGLGLENFVVNGAGDIHLHSSTSAPRPWRVGIRNPFAGKETAMGWLELKQGAVATSGDYERYFEHGGVRYHHVIDGRSGEITRSVSSVTILADTTLAADVCATAVMALGPDEGLAFINRRRDIAGFLITADGSVLRSATFGKAEGGGRGAH